jgi:hypothetical protein
MKHRPTSRPRFAIFTRVMILAVLIALGAGTGRARAQSTPPAGRVTMDPKLFVGPVRQAYTIAAANPMLLAQLDCYCGCYKTDGHKSLLDCYRSRHGATCQICTNEVLDASRMFDGGMPAEQIKQALRRKYQSAN